MDDDVPLAALAAKGPTKTPKLDDDTPLASLAKGSPAAAGKKPGAVPVKGRPSGGGAATKPKAKIAKKKGGSSSSSSSSDTSSSSSRPLRKKAAAKKGAVKKKVSQEDMDDNLDNAVKNKNRTQKQQIVADLLCRWWFSTPYLQTDWPPQEQSYYVSKLTEMKYRIVSIQEWEWVPEEDEKGRKKVYELTQFRGVFRNSEGGLVDARPKETCPCYSNFYAKETPTLLDMLLSAYENQLKELLAKSKYNTDAAAGHIKGKLTYYRDVYSKVRNNPNMFKN